MAKLEGLRIKNYRSLRDVTLGKLWNSQQTKPLTPMTVVIGKNGAGKSSLFDAFGFLGDCLRVGVEEACDLRERGGFQRLRSQGSDGPIEFELYYREDKNARPITYELSIDLDPSGRPCVQKERLRQRRKGQKQGRPFSFLYLAKGEGLVWSGLESYASGNVEDNLDNNQNKRETLQEDADSIRVQLTDQRKLGIATLGSLKEHPRITLFRIFLEGWYLSYFSPNAAREISKAGPQKHLDESGKNLGNVVQFLEREHRRVFERILSRIAEKIPDIKKITVHRDDISKNLYLLFHSTAFKDPFTHYQMSDGTLKIFAYYLLLEDPEPPPFLCIEEPENGLYHQLLEELASHFRAYANGRKGGTQVFMTTHQPYFVDALEPDEVWVLKKDTDGFSKATRACDIQFVQNMLSEGQPLGALWYSDYLDAG
ncbi:MAG: AAA family ATPase [Magnetococcales bacterium]|nr:AAA family ATPase [Magnetococcales bacterium]MBF0322602.1 AAA family ATPase [Magnetococcales bacterium]